MQLLCNLCNNLPLPPPKFFTLTPYRNFLPPPKFFTNLKKQKMITLKRVQNWNELPSSGMQLWQPNYAQKNDIEIVQDICAEWLPYGYNYGIMCEATNTLHLFRSI